jgi:exopolysaccharide biosynthesis polyprenyl glycosylphosphotransferase
MKKLIQLSIDLFHKFFLIVFDSATVLGCIWIGYHLWVESPYRLKPDILPFNWLHGLFYVLIIVAVMLWGGTYNIQSSVSHVVRQKEILKYSLIGFGVSILFSFFTKFLLVGRLQVFLTFGCMLPCILAERVLADKLWTILIVKKYLMKRIIIYGAGNTGKRLAKSIDNHPKLGYKTIGFFDDNKDDQSIIMSNPLPVIGGREKFAKFLYRNKKKIDEVLIAMPAATTKQNLHIMDLCQEYGIPYKFVPSLNDLMLHRVRQEQLDGIPLFSTEEIGIPMMNRVFKRTFDIIGSIFFLVATSPLLAIITIWIKKDSKGEAIFLQKRVGFKGKEFTMYKFRTMFKDTPDYHSHPKESRDPRITKAGRFLRKTSLDELPQFWNSLKGEMSIVGPRPEMPFIVKTYNEYQRERLNAKPGITGLWQISGDRSLPIHENIDHDLYYITHQSLMLDIIIVFETIWFALIRGVGAK